jgi:hypothetical protein
MHPEEALRVTNERVALWPTNSVELYDSATDLAKTFEQTNDVEIRKRAVSETVRVLKKAIDAGLKDTGKIGTDSRFAALKVTDEFQTFLKSLKEEPKPQ